MRWELSLAFVDAAGTVRPLPAARHRRALLDAEKLIFRTDAAARVEGLPAAATAPLVAVTATRYGVRPLGDAPAPDEVEYAVALERVLLGVLPTSTLPTIAVAAALACACYVLAAELARRAPGERKAM